MIFGFSYTYLHLLIHSSKGSREKSSGLKAMVLTQIVALSKALRDVANTIVRFLMSYFSLVLF